MKVGEIEAAVGQAAALFKAANARAQANDLDRLAGALQHLSSQDFDQFLELLGQRLEQPVQWHILALEAAGVDRNKFDHAFAALEADKAIKAGDLALIGEAYTRFAEFGRIYKSKASRLKNIRDTFEEKRNFESRGQVIDSLTPWQ